MTVESVRGVTPAFHKLASRAISDDARTLRKFYQWLCYAYWGSNTRRRLDTDVPNCLVLRPPAGAEPFAYWLACDYVARLLVSSRVEPITGPADPKAIYTVLDSAPLERPNLRRTQGRGSQWLLIERIPGAITERLLGRKWVLWLQPYEAPPALQLLALQELSGFARLLYDCAERKWAEING